MTICYGCVAMQQMGIVAEYAKDKKYYNFNVVVSSMLPKIAEQHQRQHVKIVYIHHRYKFAVLLEEGEQGLFYYLCVTTPDTAVEDTFVFLEELKRKLIIKNGNLCEAVGNCIAEQQHNNIQHNDIESAPLPVVVELDGKKVKKISALLKKTMNKALKRKKKTKKKASKNIRILGKSKRSENLTPDDAAHLTPSASNMTYYPLVSEEEITPTTENIENLQNQVEEVQGIIIKTVEEVLKRGEKLDDLLERAEELNVKAEQFQKTTKRLRERQMRANRKIIIAISCVLVVIIIGAVIGVVFFFL